MTLRGTRFFVLSLALVVAIFGSLASCASPTSITVVVTTDFGCSDLHDVTVTVGTFGNALEITPPTTVSSTCTDGYAGRVVLVPSDAKDDLVAFRVIGGFGKTTDAEACVASYDPAAPDRPSYGPGCIVARRALRYTAHTGLTVPVLLRAACAGVACTETETCLKGACVAATIRDTASCEAEGCDEGVLGPLPSVVPNGAAGLLGLTISAGTLRPAFTPDALAYGVVPSVTTLGVPFTVTPTLAPGSTATVNGAPVLSGAASTPVALALEAPTPVDVTVTQNGAATRYALVVPPVQEAYVKAPLAESGRFGTSVALSDDTLVVGAPGAAGLNGQPGVGAVDVFTRTGATWSPLTRLQANLPQRNAAFGSSVALSGDTLAIGTVTENSAFTVMGAGATYIFTRSGGVWTQQAYVNPSTPTNVMQFGACVAVSGDLLAVGAPAEPGSASGINNGEDKGAPNAGAVYVFARSGTTWLREAYIKASNNQPGMRFGSSLAFDGDTLVVGAVGEWSNLKGVNPIDTGDLSATSSGAAYVFRRTAGNWVQEAFVKASNTTTNARFGSSVAIENDTLAVGAIGERSGASGVDGSQADDGVSESGAVYVFARTGTAWNQQAYVKASNTRRDASFGNAVALRGDTLAVGSYKETGASSGVGGDPRPGGDNPWGAVYLYARRAGSWSFQAYVKASNTALTGEFGVSVALSDTTLAVGAAGDFNGATNVNPGPSGFNTVSGAGAVHILR